MRSAISLRAFLDSKCRDFSRLGAWALAILLALPAHADFQWHESGYVEYIGNQGDETAKRSQTAADKSKDAKQKSADAREMGDQIGQDRNALVPQLQQAKQQDQKNGSGASQQNKLLAQPYNPPKKYKEAFQVLGLRTNHNLYYQGQEVQEKFYSRSEELKKVAEDSFQSAKQSASAANLLRGFQVTNESRRKGMTTAGPGSGFRPVLGKRGEASSSLGGSLGKTEQAGGGSSRNQDSDLTGRSERGLESGETLQLAGGLRQESGGSDPGSSGELRRQFAGGLGPPVVEEGLPSDEPMPAEDDSYLDKSFAALDAMFDEVGGAKEQGPAAAAAAAGALAAATQAQRGEAAGGGPLLQGLIELPGGEGSRAVEQKEAGRQPASTGEVQGAGFLLDEESLFLRIRHALVRAEAGGLVLRPD